MWDVSGEGLGTSCTEREGNTGRRGKSRIALNLSLRCLLDIQSETSRRRLHVEAWHRGQVLAGENLGSSSWTGGTSVRGMGGVPLRLPVSSSEVFCFRSDTLTAPTWCTTKRSKPAGCSSETAAWCPCTHWSCSGEAK